ncbi:hypothetical protein N198_03885 [Helicobacter pylori UM037]|uniref:Transposase n=1 Tax=Helicobacter pylori UM037 TaxID=1321939 RepID=A0AB33Z993_HELPX|nr:hypothetical protein N198_03885 [Helicobacter pylori UM037]
MGALTPNLKNAQSIFCDQNNKKLSKSKRQSLKKRLKISF